MPDAATLSEPTQAPGASRALRRAVPAGVAHLLLVVRLLIGYASSLAMKVEECAAAGDLTQVAAPFGTLDPAAIIRRICRGLRRALALEELLNQRAAEGRDIEPIPPRAPAQRQSGGGESQGRGRRNGKKADDDRLPSVAEIAAEVRRRSPGAVIADICRDIGITPADLYGPEWEALRLAIAQYGGQLMCVFPAVKRRWDVAFTAWTRDTTQPRPVFPMFPRGAPAFAACGTGPP